jgi:uncharacterized membrane protein
VNSLVQMNCSLQQYEFEYLDEAFGVAVQIIGTVYSVKGGWFSDQFIGIRQDSDEI